MNAKFHYINHACFMIKKNNSAIIFDPFLDGNPEGLQANDIKANYIFISHGHFDHLGSAFEIAKNCDATIISTAEICGLAEAAGCKAHAMHLGGTFMFPFRQGSCCYGFPRQRRSRRPCLRLRSRFLRYQGLFCR